MAGGSAAAAAAAKEMRDKFEMENNAARALHKEMQQLAEGRRTYDAQINENQMVMKELDLLEEGAVVYKLLGPILLNQEVSEARSAVKKRLDYMTGEVKRLEQSLASVEEKLKEKQAKMQKMQMDYEQLARHSS